MRKNLIGVLLKKTMNNFRPRFKQAFDEFLFNHLKLQDFNHYHQNLVDSYYRKRFDINAFYTEDMLLANRGAEKK